MDNDYIWNQDLADSMQLIEWLLYTNSINKRRYEVYGDAYHHLVYTKEEAVKAIHRLVENQELSEDEKFKQIQIIMACLIEDIQISNSENIFDLNTIDQLLQNIYLDTYGPNMMYWKYQYIQFAVKTYYQRTQYYHNNSNCTIDML